MSENCNCTVEETGVDSCVGTIEYVDATYQEKTVTPTTEEQIVTPDDGYNALLTVTVQGVTHEIDPNIIAENIKYGVTILGVEGNYMGKEHKLIDFPPRVSIGGTQSEDFHKTAFTIFEEGENTGYQLTVAAEEEVGTQQLKQKVAIESNFIILGVKQFNGITQTWQWINGSPEASLVQFAKEKSIVIDNDGEEYAYKVYGNTTNYLIGERELRFYTKIVEEV